MKFEINNTKLPFVVFFFFIMICPKKRIRGEKCNPDHNETFLGFHSERRNLRQKKKRIDRSSIQNCTLKMIENHRNWDMYIYNIL